MNRHRRLVFRLEVVAIALAWVLAVVPLPAHAAGPPAELKEITQARQLLVTDPAQALQAADKIEALAKAERDAHTRQTETASACWVRAEALLRLGRIDEAKKRLVEARSYLKGLSGPQGVAGDILVTQGGIDAAEGKTAPALGQYQQAFRIFQALGDERRQALALAFIASLYREGRDFANSEKYFRQATQIYSGDQLFELSMRNNRGNVLRQMQRFDDATAEYRRALAIAEKLGSEGLQARIYANIARNQIEQGNLDEAARSLRHGMALSASGDARASRPQLIALMAHEQFLRGNLKQAGQLIAQAFKGVDPADAPASLRDANDIAYEIYAKLGDTKRALAHLEAVRTAYTETTTLATSTNAALMAARFDYQNQELKIARLSADELRNKIAFERSRAQAQRTLFISIAIAVTILIAMLSYGIVTLRRSRNQVRAANIELGETNKALEKALAAKTEFLATTSHEIRTPLNGILGMTQVMLADQRLDAAVRDRIGVVHGAGVTMRALVDDILDVAKMETGNLTVESVPMDLTATLRDVTRMWEEQARARGLSFDLDIDAAPDWIESDPSRLRQIIFNLLSNAIKFTESGGMQLSAAAVADAQGERLRIEVRDTGVGIPPEKLEEVFESFKQADTSTTRKFGGTGLGLAICRNLARALGGDIALESRVGEGSRFTVDLPLVRHAAPQPEAVRADAAAGLLVLDRNPIARSMLKTLFEPHAGSVRFTGTGDETVAMLEEGGFSCLLIDAATLTANDEDAVAQIGRLSTVAHQFGVRTAVLWVRPSEADRQAVAAAGADLCIAKPVGGAELVKAIFGDGTETGGNQPLVSRAA